MYSSRMHTTHSSSCHGVSTPHPPEQAPPRAGTTPEQAPRAGTLGASTPQPEQAPPWEQAPTLHSRHPPQRRYPLSRPPWGRHPLTRAGTPLGAGTKPPEHAPQSTYPQSRPPGVGTPPPTGTGTPQSRYLPVKRITDTQV